MGWVPGRVAGYVPGKVRTLTQALNPLCLGACAETLWGRALGASVDQKGYLPVINPVGLSRSEPSIQQTLCTRCVPAVGQAEGTHANETGRRVHLGLEGW